MSHYQKGKFTIEESIGFFLNRSRNALASEMDAALKHLDISSQQMGIFMALSSGAASTPLELSRLLDIDTGLMTRMLDKLEREEFLVRWRNVEDRRVFNLYLTDKGKEVAMQISQVAPDVMNSRLKTFTNTEFVEFRRLLKKFLSN